MNSTFYIFSMSSRTNETDFLETCVLLLLLTVILLHSYSLALT